MDAKSTDKGARMSSIVFSFSLHMFVSERSVHFNIDYFLVVEEFCLRCSHLPCICFEDHL